MSFGRRAFYLLILTLAISVICRSQSVYADSVNITIGPAINSLKVNSGSQANYQVHVINNGQLGYNYRIYVSPYGVQNDSYIPQFKQLSGFSNVTSWFKLPKNGAYLAPGATDNINFEVSVPPGTAPGSYYAAILAQSSQAQVVKNSNSVNFYERVGSLFYITVNGPVKLSGKINSWSAQFIQKPNALSTLKLENDGTVYYVTSIKVKYQDILGNTKYSYSSQKIVIPKVIRSVSVPWQNSPSFGLYKVSGQVTIYGNKTLPTKYFVIISPRSIVVVGVVVLVIIVVINLGSLKRNKREKKTD